MRSEGKEILEVFSVADDRSAAPAPGPLPRRLGAPPASASATGRRRWLVGAAGLAAAAIAVVAVTSGDDASTASRGDVSTSSPSSTTTSLAPRPAARVVLPVLADPPPGYGIAYAQKSYASTYPGVTELWSSPGVGGTWFLVTARAADPTEGQYLSGDRRVRIGDGAGVVTLARPDIHQLANVTAILHDQWYVSITGAFDASTLAGILDGVSVLDTDSDGGPDEIDFADDGFKSDHHLVSRIGSADSGGSGLYLPEDSVVSFTPPDTSEGGIWVSSSRQLSPSQQALYDYFLHDEVPLQHGAITGHFGQVDGGGNQLMFELAGITITVSGSADRDTLVAVAESAHIAGTDEWNEARANAHNPAETRVVDGMPDVTLVAFGTLDNQPWSIGAYPLSPGVGYPYSMLVGQSGAYGVIVDPLTQSDIEVRATGAGTFVMGVVPRDAAPGSKLRISVFGAAAPIEVELTAIDADPPLPWFAGAVVFSDLNPWQAQIVAADGTVLAAVTSDLDGLPQPSDATGL